MKVHKIFYSSVSFLLALVLTFSLSVSVLPVTAAAVSETDIEALTAEKEKIASQVSSVEEKLVQLRSQQATVMEQKDALDERNVYTQEQIELTNEQLDLCNQMIEEKKAEVAAAKEVEEKQLQVYRTRVRAMEESGGYNILSIVLRSSSLSELMSAIDDIGEIMENDRKLEDAYIAAREEYEAAEADYEAQKVTLDSTIQELNTEKADLEAQLDEVNELLESLADDIAAAEAEEAALQASQAATSAELSNLVAQLNAQNSEIASGGDSGDSGTVSAASEGVSGTGSLVWPVPSSYRVSSCYKYRNGRHHDGIDIDGYGLDGNPVVACDSGVVVAASYGAAYGNYVMIDHGNGIQTVYAHMSGLAVSYGETVSQGQTIGYLGRTGNATGTHCHLEVYVNGSRVDPLSYFSGYTLEPGAADES